MWICFFIFYSISDEMARSSFFSFRILSQVSIVMIFFHAFVASLDGFFMGMALRIRNISFSLFYRILFLFGNLFLYTFFLCSYQFFSLPFFTKPFSIGCYLFLFFFSLRSSTDIPMMEMKFFPFLTVLLSHVLDGGIISLQFVYSYPIWFLVFLFSFFSYRLFFFGFSFGKYLPFIQKSNYLVAFFFFLLLILHILF